MVDPAPVPSPGQKWFTDASTLTYVLTSVVAVAAGVGTAVGHPFGTNALNALATTVAWAAAGIITVVFVHGQNKLALQRAQHAHEAHVALIQRGAAV